VVLAQPDVEGGEPVGLDQSVDRVPRAVEEPRGGLDVQVADRVVGEDVIEAAGHQPTDRARAITFL
jgi:hypothetical protein